MTYLIRDTNVTRGRYPRWYSDDHPGASTASVARVSTLRRHTARVTEEKRLPSRLVAFLPPVRRNVASQDVKPVRRKCRLFSGFVEARV